MDFLKLQLDTGLEGLVTFLNALLEFMIVGVQNIYHVKQFLDVEQYFLKLKEYSHSLAYSMLLTVILIFILKVYIFEESSMDISEFVFRIFKTIIAIETTPILMGYIATQSSKILNRMLSLVTVTVPSIDVIDFSSIIAAIPLMPNLLLSFLIAMTVISIVMITTWFIVFIVAIMLSILLMILEILAPLAALSNMSEYPAIYIMFLKDVCRIYISRLFQLTLLKISCMFIVSAQIKLAVAIIDAKDSITNALIYAFMQNIFAFAMIVTLIFLPKTLEKYVSTNGSGSSGSGRKAVSTLIAIGSKFM